MEDVDLHRRIAVSWPDSPFIVDPPMNSRIFEAWIEAQPVPTPSLGDAVILDNVSSQKSERAEQLVKAKGAWLLFLPPLLICTES